MSAVERAREQILALVTELHAVEGSKLPSERALAAQLDVSRSTVREALRGLAEQGGLVAHHGSSWVVQAGSEPLVDALSLQLQIGDLTTAHLLESRLVIEPSVAAMAARRRTIEDVAELTRLFLFMSEAKSDANFIHYDITFHAHLARCTGNGFFLMAIKPLLLALEQARKGSLEGSVKREPVLSEHKAILDAVQRRDDVGAQRCMRQHVHSFAQSAGLDIPETTASGDDHAEDLS